MAQHGPVISPMGAVTQITNSDVAAITFQNKSVWAVWVGASIDENAPNVEEMFIYLPTQGEAKTMSELFPGIPNAKRVFTFCAEGDAEVMVSHA